MDTHQFAFTGHRSGAKGMRAPCRVVYTIDGRRGRCDEFLHDGDAFVIFDDGSHETVKWHHLEPEPTE